MNKPIEIKLPHFLTGLSTDKLQDCGVGFMKANHAEKIDQHGQIYYKFQDICEDNVEFISDSESGVIGAKSFGILTTNHCCFYCITEKRSPVVALDATYCLIRIENSLPPNFEVHFVTIYFLETCLKVKLNFTWIFFCHH